MEDKKVIWKSKTFWVNVVAVVAALTGTFGIDLGLDPETQVAVVGTIMGIVNIILRFVTTKSVGL